MKKIEAIQHIKNIGKFNNCEIAGCQFNDNTIIYGKNTLGKSTLTSIFRSLQTGNKKIIEGKKTFGSTNQPAIKIRFTDGTNRELIDFNSHKWSEGKPNILIFDTQFISENVFQGEQITFDNQKSLNQIIIGAKGLDLNIAIQNLQNELTELTERKRKLTSDFNKLLPSSEFENITIEKFCALPELSELDEQILSKKEEYERAKNKEVITKALDNHLSYFQSIINLDINNVLQKTINFNHQEIEQHIKNHWKSHKASKDFLKQGLELTKDDKKSCVFCGQNLGESELNLIKTYEGFFKGEYQQIQNQVLTIKGQIDKTNLEGQIGKFLLDIEKYSLKTELNSVFFAEITSEYIWLIEDLRLKSNDLYFIPLKNYSESIIDGLKQLTIEIQRIIEKYFPKNNSTISLSEILTQIKSLELSKKRIQDAYKNICKDYHEINEEFEKKRVLRESKRKDLEVYSLEIFDKHKSSINDYLHRMGANFMIDDLLPIKKLKGSDEKLFSIKFYNSHQVKLDSSDDEIPNFKNSLSESDKRALAFAFFLSLLGHDNELDNKILVFDDPFSSFDEERKRDTIQLLADIQFNDGIVVKIPLQKIILTHEKTFYREIYLKSFIQPHTLKIEFDGFINGINTSTIKHCNIDEEFPDDQILAKIKRLKEIHISRSFNEKYDGDCRIVLENIFKRKYSFILEEAIKQRKSVRTFTTTLESKYSQSDYSKLLRLCNDLNIELHDNNAQPSEGDHASILRDFFECLEII
ncbi:AAA family ATPase [Flavobacterium limnophilum]|uniref:AAA family ATPase n=1 Tax=Flavobacterium limnophilum TaxID=3003262 RepID=UPI002482F793|nr:AAA family ATPase [Flavobacterium limnophilum]